MTTKTITLIKREALFVPYESLPPSLIRAIKEKYSFRFYNDKACAKCEFAVDKHSDLCETCAAYQGGKKLAYKMKVGGKPYLKMPIGDIRHIEASFRIKGYEVEYVDKNPRVKIKPFKFTGTLKDFQEESVEVLAEKKRGILKSPPRSGKTVMATALTAALGLKTIIIASQRDWLVGFLETFIGSKTQKPLTNLNKSRIGFAKKLEDFDKYDICLCTVQTFWSEKGQALLAKVRDKFSIAIYDECFPAGTLVHTDKGVVPIETVVNNPTQYRAWSFNHASQCYELRQVLRGFRKKSEKKLLTFNLEDGSSFTCTADHKLWSEALGKYVEARHFSAGDSLMVKA